MKEATLMRRWFSGFGDREVQMYRWAVLFTWWSLCML